MSALLINPIICTAIRDEKARDKADLGSEEQIYSPLIIIIEFLGALTEICADAKGIDISARRPGTNYKVASERIFQKQSVVPSPMPNSAFT